MNDLTTTEAKVLNIILPYRIESPIKFETIRNKSGIGRRKLQLIIESLKTKSHPIGSIKSGDVKGLYMARNLAELEQGLKANLKQAETTIKIADIQRNIDFEKYWSNSEEG